MSTHLSIALSDYSNFDSISDKEFYFLLEKYKCEKELDMTPMTSEKDLEEIYNDAQDLSLDNILDEDDDEY